MDKLKKLFRNKKGRFVDAFRTFTVGNIFFGFLILLVGMFSGSYLLKQLGFIKNTVNIGLPVQLLILTVGIVTVFFIVIKSQGNIDRSRVFVILLMVVAIGALFYFLPRILPEIFNNSSITQSALATNPYSPFPILYNLSVQGHNALQSIIPIP